MPALKKDVKANEMYAIYEQGKSLSQIADQYACSRQSVYELLKARGFQLRSKTNKDSVEFNGNRYTVREHGYLAKTNGARTLMHRDVWEYHNGPIPEDCDIHHLDEVKTNNEISNLQMLTKSEHGKTHGFRGNQYRKDPRK